MELFPFPDYSQIDCRSIVNDLEVGIVIFHGKNTDELFPVFCNEFFLRLCGFTLEDFKKNVTKVNHYCIHPEDIESVRKKVRDAIESKTPINHILRVKASRDNTYKWVSMNGNAVFKKDGSFDVLLTFGDAEETAHSRNILVARYKNLIEKSKQVNPDSLTSLLFNLTADQCVVIYNSLKPKVPIEVFSRIDEFIARVSKNIAEPKLREEFVRQFSKKELIASFNKGMLSFEMKFPVRLENEQILWCKQVSRLTRNPENNNLECIVLLIEDDKDIRLRNSFNAIMKNDYELVANMNMKTGLVRIISSKNSRGLPDDQTTFYHNDVVDSRMRELLEAEFVELGKRAFSSEVILNELKNKDLYVCTFPARTKLLGHDGAFQWRFSYIDDTKEEIVFTRSETLGFLDNRQKLKKELSEMQQKAIQIGENAKSGFTKRYKILIADDSDINREMLAIIFDKDFEIIEASDGEETIHLIDKNYDSLALILLDMQMPKKTGLDVLVHLKMRNLQDMIPTILVTGSTSKELGLRSLEYGISDIINKPFDSKIVKRRALNLIELYAHKEEIEMQLDIWKQDAIKMHKQAEENNDLLINALSSVVEFRSIESGSHIKRVRKLTEVMLKTWAILEPEQNLSDLDIEQIARASTLHDIGKVAIPDNILLKPGRLTPVEFDIMKSHTTLGCKFLEQIKQDNSDFYKYCYDICRHHHERADGRGYPDGLKGDEIPFWSQIVSVVDVYDALISPRVYKEPIPSEKAIEMIYNGECGIFSERLLNCFKKAKDEIVYESKKMADEN